MDGGEGLDRESVLRDYEEYQRQGRVWGQVSVERIRRIRFPRTDRATIEQYLELEELTTTISDALDRRGIKGAVSAARVSPLQTGRRMVGNAITQRAIAERKTPTQGWLDSSPINMSTREIYSLAEPGDVFVTDCSGNVDISNFGGQSALAAKSHGLAGAIVNGAVRDVATLRRIDYPVWAAGATPISGKYRIETVEINGPVMLYDVTVHPGDLIAADDSGICVVPAEHIADVLEEAQASARKEAHVRSLLKAGADIATLRPLYHKHEPRDDAASLGS